MKSVIANSMKKEYRTNNENIEIGNNTTANNHMQIPKQKENNHHTANTGQIIKYHHKINIFPLIANPSAFPAYIHQTFVHQTSFIWFAFRRLKQ